MRHNLNDINCIVLFEWMFETMTLSWILKVERKSKCDYKLQIELEHNSKWSIRNIWKAKVNKKWFENYYRTLLKWTFNISMAWNLKYPI